MCRHHNASIIFVLHGGVRGKLSVVRPLLFVHFFYKTTACVVGKADVVVVGGPDAGQLSDAVVQVVGAVAVIVLQVVQ